MRTPGTRRQAIVAALAALLLAPGVQAGPAPWYLWRSKIDGVRVCAQNSLGLGWERVAGPYKDSRCETAALVK